MGRDSQIAKMRMPRPNDSLSWGKCEGQSMPVKDAGVVSSASSSLQNFTKDGSFTCKVLKYQGSDDSCTDMSKSEEPSAYIKPTLSANQLAAKVMQLRMKGKHQEADILLKQSEGHKGKSKSGTVSTHPHGVRMSEKKKEEDGNMHVARWIVQNKQYKADDEYE